MKLDIVYQTDDFIIIYKPCGLSVHKDQSEIGLTTLLARQLDVPQAWLVHRLDKVTSGLLILALNAESAAGFFRLFSEHHIQKTYLALSNQKPKKKQGLIVGDMQKSRNRAWKLCQSKENPAITFKMIKQAFINLYGSLDKMSDDALDFITSELENPSDISELEKIEEENKNLLQNFEKEYSDVLNENNVSYVLQNLKDRSKSANSGSNKGTKKMDLFGTLH